MRRTLALRLASIYLLGHIAVASDCNLNGVPDEVDLWPRFAMKARYPLQNPCMFFTAWPRDTAIATGDLDGDGDPELIMANCGDCGDRIEPCNPGSSISILFNEGGGIYGSEVILAVGTIPIHVVAVDLDGDGDLDLATANEGSADVSVLMNDGGGAFSAPESYAVEAPFELAPADFDGDGDVDLAAANMYFITILLNSGTGQFEPGGTVSGGDSYYLKTMTAADLDGDGDVDLIGSDRSVYVWKNAGDGHFGEPASYALTAGNPGICWPHELVAVDLDGDTYPDIATADYTDGGTPSVSILMNQGDGTFGPVEFYPVESRDENHFISTGDFDIDGDIDIATVACDTLGILFNEGNGAFSGPDYYEIEGCATNIAALDVDGDPHPELAVKRWLGEGREILLYDAQATSLDLDGHGVPDECEPPIVLIESDEEWRFLRGFGPPSGERDWRDPAFDDGAWDRGPTGIGYGDDDDRTVLADMRGSYVTVYARKSFEIGDPSAMARLMLEVAYDDGFIAYLNGFEVARSATMGNPGEAFRYDQAARGLHDAGTFELFDVTSGIEHLASGTNVLAVEVHNSSLNSSDLSFIPRLLDDVASQAFRRGDTNADGRTDISDAVVILGYLFAYEFGALPCEKAGDANDDGKIDLADPVRILTFLFAGGGPLPEPSKRCGTDAIADGLTCDSFAPCGA